MVSTIQTLFSSPVLLSPGSTMPCTLTLSHQMDCQMDPHGPVFAAMLHFSWPGGEGIRHFVAECVGRTSDRHYLSQVGRNGRNGRAFLVQGNARTRSPKDGSNIIVKSRAHHYCSQERLRTLSTPVVQGIFIPMVKCADLAAFWLRAFEWLEAAPGVLTSFHTINFIVKACKCTVQFPVAKLLSSHMYNSPQKVEVCLPSQP